MSNRFQKDLNRLIHHPPGTGRLSSLPARGALPGNQGIGRPGPGAPTQQDLPVENPTLFFHDRVYSPQAWSGRTWNTLNSYAAVDLSGSIPGGEGLQSSYSSVNGHIALLAANLTGTTSATSEIISDTGAAYYTKNGGTVIHSFCRHGTDWFVVEVDDATDPLTKTITVTRYDTNWAQLATFNFSYTATYSLAVPGIAVTENRVVLWVSDGSTIILQFRDFAGNLLQTYTGGSQDSGQMIMATDRTVVMTIVGLNNETMTLLELNEYATVVARRDLATSIAYGVIAAATNKAYDWTIAASSQDQVVNIRDRTETRDDTGRVTKVIYSDPISTLTPQSTTYQSPLAGWAINHQVAT